MVREGRSVTFRQFIEKLYLGLLLSASLYRHNSARARSYLPVKDLSGDCRLQNSIFFKNKCLQCLQKEATSQAGRNFSTEQSLDINGDLILVQCHESSMSLQKWVEYVAGRKIAAVTIERPPFVMKTADGFGGVIFEFLDFLAAKYNFSMKILHPHDGNWGAPLGNGSWNGMIGMVLRNEAEIGAASFSVTWQRSQAVDFTDYFHHEPSAILIPPPTAGGKLTVLIRPLSKQVWAGVLGTVIIVIPSIYLLHRGSNAIRGYPNRYGIVAGCAELLWFIIGSILQQSLQSQTAKSTRFVTIIWWFVTFIIANAYLAFLVSFLSAPKLQNVVNSLEDLAAQHKIKWTYRSNTAHISLFKSESNTGTYKLIGDGTNEKNLVTSDRDGVERVLKNHYAFIKEKSFLDVVLAKDFQVAKTCRMTLAKKTFFTVGFALTVPKKSPLLFLLNYGLSKSISSGIMDKWKHIHWPKNLWCADAISYILSTSPRSRKLTLADLQGAFALFGVGLLLSILSFIGEHSVTQIVSRLRFRIFRLRCTHIWRFVR